MIVRQVAVDRVGESSRLHGADTHHAHPPRARRRDQIARPGLLVVGAHRARRIEQVGHALDGGRRRVLGQRLQQGAGHAHPTHPPGPDRPVRHHRLERGPHRLHEQAAGRSPPLEAVRDDHPVQEEEVDALQPEPVEARRQRLPQRPRRRPRGHVPEVVLRRDAYALRQPSPERLPHHAFRLAVAVAGRHVEEGDAAVHRCAHRLNGFLAGRRAPDAAGAAAPEREGADRPELPEHSCFHAHESTDRWLRSPPPRSPPAAARP